MLKERSTSAHLRPPAKVGRLACVSPVADTLTTPTLTRHSKQQSIPGTFCWRALTIRSSRTGFASRLNSGVRP